MKYRKYRYMKKKNNPKPAPKVGGIAIQVIIRQNCPSMISPGEKRIGRGPIRVSKVTKILAPTT